MGRAEARHAHLVLLSRALRPRTLFPEPGGYRRYFRTDWAQKTYHYKTKRFSSSESEPTKMGTECKTMYHCWPRRPHSAFPFGMRQATAEPPLCLWYRLYTYLFLILLFQRVRYQLSSSWTGGRLVFFCTQNQSGENDSATPVTQCRNPVGAGPSSKTCPKWPPFLAHGGYFPNKSRSAKNCFTRTRLTNRNKTRPSNQQLKLYF